MWPLWGPLQGQAGKDAHQEFLGCPRNRGAWEGFPLYMQGAGVGDGARQR